MVIQSVNGAPVPSTPLRPSALSTFSLAARMKRGGGARRALSTLGPNDTQANLRLAESLLTVSQDKFIKKWNFDPVNIVPLAPGRYQWTSATSPAEPKDTSINTNTKDILTCFTLPKSGFSHPTTEPRVPTLNQCHASEGAKVSATSSPDTKVQDNNDSGIETDESFSESPSAPSRSSSNTQTTITDYLRCSKKRLLVIDDAAVELLPASKRRQQGEGSVEPGLSTTTSDAAATSPTSVTSSVLPETPSVLQK